MKFLKKFLSITIVFLVLIFNNLPYLTAYAQEEVTTPTPTTESEVVVENAAEVVDTIDSNSNTGENEISIVVDSPTPSNTPSPSESPLSLASSTPLPTASPDAITVETEEEVLSPTVESSPTPVSEITTSDAVSVVEVENNINSNVINSEFIRHTLNIYLPESGNIDLSSLTSNVINKVYGNDANLSENISVRVTDINNFAYIENNISSIANTGGNNIENSQNASINTSDAYSAISVLNNVNTNIIDSKIHLVTINIFGHLEGNIILPETVSLDTCTNCSTNISLLNTATVNNQITSNTNTGNNNITTTGSADIITGEAESAVNILNLVNTNLVDTVFRYLYINTLGDWIGDFLGWGDEEANTADNIFINSTCTYCSSNAIGGTNVASISNNISSSSNTGNNQIENAEDANIKTGNAYSSVSLVNLVNSNFINSQGFIGFINIFGTLVGDIGGTSVFEEEAISEVVSEPEVQEEPGPELKESGGILEVTHTNNVGTHVLPGDTVTFQAKIKNVGYGKIYNAKLTIELFKDGKSYGGTYFNLGDINAQKTTRLTTGLVMSKKALSGKYIAKVTATGTVGPENTEISSSSESEFKIIGFNTNTVLSSGTNPSPINPETVEIIPEVLGTSASDIVKDTMLTIFAWLLVLYLGLRGIQKRQIVLSYAQRIGSLLM